MTDIEVCVAVAGETQPVGLLRRHSSRVRRESYTFEYSESWLRHSGRFALEPHLQLTEGAFAPLPRLSNSAQRILRDEDTDEDWRLIMAPGSSLGGARPKASVVDREGRLHIAKFPKDNDEYSFETWEEVALNLAERAGMDTPEHQLVAVAGKAVLLSRRFDRENGARVPYLSALALLGAADGQRASYPEIIDELGRCGSQTKADGMQMYRRVAFNVLCSNVDDHLRNHGFLRCDRSGWSLAPAFDLNPTPADLKARVLSTNIDLDEGTCSIGLLESAAGYFGLSLKPARQIIGEVAQATES